MNLALSGILPAPRRDQRPIIEPIAVMRQAAYKAVRTYRNGPRRSPEQVDDELMRMVASFKRPVAAMDVIRKHRIAIKYTMHRLLRLTIAGRLRRSQCGGRDYLYEVAK